MTQRNMGVLETLQERFKSLKTINLSGKASPWFPRCLSRKSYQKYLIVEEKTSYVYSIAIVRQILVLLIVDTSSQLSELSQDVVRIVNSLIQSEGDFAFRLLPNRTVYLPCLSKTFYCSKDQLGNCVETFDSERLCLKESLNKFSQQLFRKAPESPHYLQTKRSLTHRVQQSLPNCSLTQVNGKICLTLENNQTLWLETIDNLLDRMVVEFQCPQWKDCDEFDKLVNACNRVTKTGFFHVSREVLAFSCVFVCATKDEATVCRIIDLLRRVQGYIDKFLRVVKLLPDKGQQFSAIEYEILVNPEVYERHPKRSGYKRVTFELSDDKRECEYQLVQELSQSPLLKTAFQLDCVQWEASSVTYCVPQFRMSTEICLTRGESERSQLLDLLNALKKTCGFPSNVLSHFRSFNGKIFYGFAEPLSQVFTQNTPTKPDAVISHHMRRLCERRRDVLGTLEQLPETLLAHSSLGTLDINVIHQQGIDAYLQSHKGIRTRRKVPCLGVVPDSGGVWIVEQQLQPWKRTRRSETISKRWAQHALQYTEACIGNKSHEIQRVYVNSKEELLLSPLVDRQAIRNTARCMHHSLGHFLCSMYDSEAESNCLDYSLDQRQPHIISQQFEYDFPTLTLLIRELWHIGDVSSFRKYYRLLDHFTNHAGSLESVSKK